MRRLVLTFAGLICAEAQAQFFGGFEKFDPAETPREATSMSPLFLASIRQDAKAFSIAVQSGATIAYKGVNHPLDIGIFKIPLENCEYRLRDRPVGDRVIWTEVKWNCKDSKFGSSSVYRFYFAQGKVGWVLNYDEPPFPVTLLPSK